MKTLQEAIMVFFADLLNVFAYQKAKVMGVMLDWSATNVLLHNAWLRRRRSRRPVEAADIG